MNKPITIAICFFLSFILAVGLIHPKYQELSAVQEKARGLEIELQFREEYFKKLGNISEQLKKYEEPLIKINSALPNSPSLPILFDWAVSQVAQVGMTLKEINVLDITFLEEIPKVQETRISLDIMGSYSSFKNFLLIIENSARMIKIESISFEAPKEEEGAFIFNLKIKTYSY